MPAPVVIVDKKKFQEHLALALKRTEQLTGEVSGWPAGALLLPQLEHIRAATAAGRAATEEELARINIGILAVREVQGVDPELADSLQELDYAYRRFEDLP